MSTERHPPIKKIEVVTTDVEGKKRTMLVAYMPEVRFEFQYPINQYYCMGQAAPIQEHTGRVEFSFKGSGLTLRPRKPKKAKPLSKRAQRALEERIAEQEGWED